MRLLTLLMLLALSKLLRNLCGARERKNGQSGTLGPCLLGTLGVELSCVDPQLRADHQPVNISVINTRTFVNISVTNTFGKHQRS